jgi:hypothetical protein
MVCKISQSTTDRPRPRRNPPVIEKTRFRDLDIFPCIRADTFWTMYCFTEVGIPNPLCGLRDLCAMLSPPQAVSRTEANVFIHALSSTNPKRSSPIRNYSIEKTPNDIGSISKHPSWNTAPCTSSGRNREDLITSPKVTVQACSAGLIATMMRSVPATRR